jgi:hypothetical protein
LLAAAENLGTDDVESAACFGVFNSGFSDHG